MHYIVYSLSLALLHSRFRAFASAQAAAAGALRARAESGSLIHLLLPLSRFSLLLERRRSHSGRAGRGVKRDETREYNSSGGSGGGGGISIAPAASRRAPHNTRFTLPLLSTRRPEFYAPAPAPLPPFRFAASVSAVVSRSSGGGGMRQRRPAGDGIRVLNQVRSE